MIMPFHYMCMTGAFGERSGGMVSPSGVGAFDSEEHSARQKMGEDYNLSHHHSLHQWGEGKLKPQLSVGACPPGSLGP